MHAGVIAHLTHRRLGLCKKPIFPIPFTIGLALVLLTTKYRSHHARKYRLVMLEISRPALIAPEVGCIFGYLQFALIAARLAYEVVFIHPAFLLDALNHFLRLSSTHPLPFFSSLAAHR